MKTIFSKSAPRDIAKMIHLIKQNLIKHYKTFKIFLLISGRFFGHFNAKNQCKVNYE